MSFNSISNPNFNLSKDESYRISSVITEILIFEEKISDIYFLKSLILGWESGRYNYFLDDFDDEIEIFVNKSDNHLSKEILKVINIFKSKENDDFSDDDWKKIEKVKEGIIQKFKKRYNSIDSEDKELSKKLKRVKFEQSFPIKFQYENKSYYGLCRPPSGIITFLDFQSREAFLKLNISVKIPLKKDEDNIYYVDKYLIDKRIQYDDTQESKEKVVKLMTHYGCDYRTCSYIFNGDLSRYESSIKKFKNKNFEKLFKI